MNSTASFTIAAIAVLISVGSILLTLFGVARTKRANADAKMWAQQAKASEGHTKQAVELIKTIRKSFPPTMAAHDAPTQEQPPGESRGPDGPVPR